MLQLLAVSRAIDRCLAAIARLSGWLFVVTSAVICFDVITRKIGFQLPHLGSTRLQELEWHLAAILFLGWIGYGVVRNSHVRIDVFTSALSPETRDRIDLFGALFFALPYCLVVLPYAFDFFLVSFGQMESSDAPTGLPARFVIKGFLAFGILLILLGAISFLLRRIVDVFGPPELHSRALAAREVEL
jgi:TRAP-type mannitol/chloroaromatic compound transport system permease small subunit